MKITIKGVPPYDGTYPVDAPYNIREMRIFKRIGGILPGTFMDAAMAGDVDVLLSLAIIGLHRAGQAPVEDVLLESELGKILIEPDEDEVDAVPPPQRSGEPETRLSESRSSSGTSGNTGGDSPQEKNLNGTGLLDSGTGVTSDPATLVT